jgi:hypothetical protein
MGNSIRGTNCPTGTQLLWLMEEEVVYDFLRPITSKIVTKYHVLAQVQSFTFLDWKMTYRTAEDIDWKVTRFKYVSRIIRRVTEGKHDQNQWYCVKYWHNQYSCTEVKLGLRENITTLRHRKPRHRTTGYICKVINAIQRSGENVIFLV